MASGAVSNILSELFESNSNKYTHLMKRIKYSNAFHCNLYKVSKKVDIMYMYIYSLHVCMLGYVYITICHVKSYGLYN